MSGAAEEKDFLSQETALLQYAEGFLYAEKGGDEAKGYSGDWQGVAVLLNAKVQVLICNRDMNEQYLSLTRRKS